MSRPSVIADKLKDLRKPSTKTSGRELRRKSAKMYAEELMTCCEVWSEERDIPQNERKQRVKACKRVYDFLFEDQADSTGRRHLEEAKIRWALMQHFQSSSSSEKIIEMAERVCEALRHGGFTTVQALRSLTLMQLWDLNLDLPEEDANDQALCVLLKKCPEKPVLDFTSFKLLSSLPDFGELHGTLNVSGLDRLKQLPGSMHVTGSLGLIETGLESLPESLEVDGHLCASRCANLYLRQPLIRLIVQGDMNLSRCTKIRKLRTSARFEVKGNLDLDHCTSLEELGDDLMVGGALTLRDCTSLKRISTYIDVGSYIEMQGCTSLTSIPAGLPIINGLGVSMCSSIKALDFTTSRIKGSLFAANMASLETAPRILEVVQDVLNFSNCPELRRLPSRLRRVGMLDASRCTSLERIPSGLRVERSCNLSGCTSLRSLPSRLRTGNLRLRCCTALEELPADLRVDGDLDLFGCTGLRRLQSDIQERVQGRIHPWNCPNLELPNGWIVNDDLYLTLYDELTYLPEHLEVFGDVWIIANSLTKFPKGFKPHLNVYSSEAECLETLCDDLHVPGSLLLPKCRNLRSLGRHLQIGGNLDLGGCTALARLRSIEVGQSLNLRDCVALCKLPRRFTVGEDLSIEGCLNITELPTCIFDWGPTISGGKHNIYLAGSGITQAMISRLRSSQTRNLRFHFDMRSTVGDILTLELAGSRASRVELDMLNGGEFSSFEHALAFWFRKAGREEPEDTLPLEQYIEPSDRRGVLQFLSKLRLSKEFRNENLQVGLARRVLNALNSVVNDEYARSEIIGHMVDSVDACGDKPIWALNQLTLVGLIGQARGDRNALRRLGLGVMRLEIVHQHCVRKISSLSAADDVCVFLRFEISLKDDLELPVSSEDMLFPQYMHVSDEEIDEARRAALDVSGADFEIWLETWPEWQRQLRLEAAEALIWEELPRNSRRFSLSWTDVMGNNNISDPVRIGSNSTIWSMRDLLKHWIATGLDLNNQTRSIDEIKRLTRARSISGRRQRQDIDEQIPKEQALEQSFPARRKKQPPSQHHRIPVSIESTRVS